MAKKKNITISSHVSFKNSQGVAAEGSLVRLSRQAVVFEVYNPYSIVQLSEVLTELTIHQGDRATYNGRAVITGLLNTGLILIVSASLVDPWSDLNNLGPGHLLRSFVRDFVQDWEDANARVGAPFRLAVTSLRNYLQELRRWLEHWETEASISAESDVNRVLDFVQDVDQEIAPRFAELNGEFERVSREVSRRDLPFHRAFAQRELHPLLMASPFMNRAFNKPLGYAGDYEMVRMMLTEPWEGANTFAKLVNASALRHDAPAAHRNRIEMLHNALAREAYRVLALRQREQSGDGRGANRLRVRVLNIGCGPAVEIDRFAKSDPASAHMDFRLVDFNDETLQFVQRHLIPEVKRVRPEIEIATEQRSVHEILKMSHEGGHEGAFATQYDVVYCAGLFDYLRDATCGYLLELFYSWVAPGGMVLVTNVTPSHSSVAMMGMVLDWNLELRTMDDMRALAPDIGEQNAYVDATGVNVFLEIRKPAS
ncbi:class I SAM-dependent methyltransferase [Roseiconus nitratireducens]|uniref:Class I SAM-dependent methyltransferase n=1 Tax=Roseiconus nitratireducens TaxID=2605748 RepID=A0A5M6CUT4_9BACT|nr:class I SAM-dependent methyltransferase [Roseiconus nitratireducens]KAA5538823.1 class I SAM-dependent methyltransferase [Roseiconus nitratireducens]